MKPRSGARESKRECRGSQARDRWRGLTIDKRGEVARPTSGWTGERTSRAAPD